MGHEHAHHANQPASVEPRDTHSHHGHDHAHSAGHSHAPSHFGFAFAVGIILNTGFVAIEAGYGFLSGSMALVADAGHNLSDVLGLLLAWGATIAARRPASGRFTYGLKSSTILAALGNAGLLLVAIVAILLETIHRIAVPTDVQGDTMIFVAGVGILINTATALMFMRGRHDDLNVRGAFLHMAADALVSLGVVIAGVAVLLTGETWIDPMVSLIIVIIIAWSTLGLLRDSVAMSLLAVPKGINIAKVRSFLEGQSGVSAVHDLHIWPMSTTETALTAHIVMPAGYPGDRFLRDISHVLEHDYRIGHTTIQVEVGEDCPAHGSHA